MLMTLKRLTSTVVALAFIVGAAAVAMEAMGLIFQTGSADPGQRLDAVVAHIEASVDPRDVPSEAEDQGLWPPEHDKRPKQTVGQKQAADLPGGEATASTVAAGGAWVMRVVTEPDPEPAPVPEAGPDPGPEAGLDAGPEAGTDAETEEAAHSVPPEPTPVVAAKRGAAPAPTPAPMRGPLLGTVAAPKRAKAPRKGRSVGCLLSAWMTGL